MSYIPDNQFRNGALSKEMGARKQGRLVEYSAVGMPLAEEYGE